nr:hypothetical protein [Tanacetum cinerariifolium]
MSSASSAVTYTSIYTNSEPVAPPSSDYIPGPEELQTPPTPQDEDEHEPMFTQPHDLDFVPEHTYPEYIPLEDEHILLAEEQPLPPVDPEEYKDDETEDGPVNYPMDGGDDGDDDDGDSSRDDADDKDEDKEEEGHLAPADSAMLYPLMSLFPHLREQSLLLAMPTPSPPPLTSLSPPSTGERLARCTAPAALPSPPLLSNLHMPPHANHRDDILEAEMPPRKSTLDTEARRRGIGEVGYGIGDT